MASLGWSTPELEVAPACAYLEGMEIHAGCACLENRIGSNGCQSITDAFRHFCHVPTLNRNPQRKEILCDLLSVTKASCSIARATNRIASFASDRSRSRTSFFVRCDDSVQSRNWNSSRSSRAERPPDKRKTAERYRAGRPTFACQLRLGRPISPGS